MTVKTSSSKAGSAMPVAARILGVVLAAGAASVTVGAQSAAPAQRQPATSPRVSQRAPAAPGPVRVSPDQIDFGFVKPNTTVEATARIFNDSDQPFRIVKAVPSCQCTTVELDGKIIPAQGELAFPVSMKVPASTGIKHAGVNAIVEGVNTKAQLRISFKIQAEVVYSIRAVTQNAPGGSWDPYIDAAVDAQDPASQAKAARVRGEVSLSSLDQRPFNVLSVGMKPPQFVDWDPSQPPRNTYRVRYDVSAPDCASMPRYLIIETDHPESPLVDMRVRHQCTHIKPRLQFAEFRANAGIITPTQPGSFDIEVKGIVDTVIDASGKEVRQARRLNTPAGPLRITGVTSTRPEVKAELVGQKFDGEHLLVSVRLTPTGATNGVFLFPVRFDVSMPGEPPFTDELLVFGKLAPQGTASAAGSAPRSPGLVSIPESVRAEILTPPTAPLSERISADKITTLTVPPVPTQVVSPLPVTLRIADRAEVVPVSPERYAVAVEAIDRGLAWLRAAQGPDGGWMETTPAAGTDQARTSPAATLAVTGLILKAFAQRGVPVESDANVAKAVDFLRSRAWKDGTFDPDPTGALGNYAASFITMGLASLNTSASRDWVNECVVYLKANQWDQKQGVAPDRDWFGGAGYGNGRRPDLSNTQVFLDALHDAGIQPTDPSVQKALVFVSRCQNDPQFNSAAWASDGTEDGGMVYTSANGGESMASAAAGEGRAGEKLPPGTPRSLRSYGSMTYAGFKSLLYAGLTPDDPRVRDALAWIGRHWTFAENPGMGQEGRYYYLHAMSRALHAAGRTTLTDASGVEHVWRDELIDAILALQKPDGSFVNSAERWMESKPELATAYLVLALEEAIKPSLAVEP